MSKFNKHETTTVRNNGEEGLAAIYVHRSTGLVVGVSEDQGIFDGHWVKANGRKEMDILKHVWVEAWYSGETVTYWVDDLDDVQSLEELLNETVVSSPTIVASREFIKTAMLEL